MNRKIPTPTYGAEIEKAYTLLDGSPYSVGDAYFEGFRAIKVRRGETVAEKHIGGRLIGIATPRSIETLDNGFNNGESAVGPVLESDGGLHALAMMLEAEVRDSLEVLRESGAGILNMGNHPLTPITQEFYRRTVVPKPAYGYIVRERGWHHESGIDAKAQNSPSTGVPAECAVRAMNVVMGFGAAFVALYANSPFEEGKVSGFKESRLTMWPKMFRAAHLGRDQHLHEMPEKPFRNLREYLQWMFGSGTAMFFVPAEAGAAGAKSAQKLALIEGNPSLLEFLRKKTWSAKVYGTGDRVSVTPSMSHVDMQQFTQFTGARVRFALRGDFTVEEFLAAMSGTDDEVEMLFAQKAKYTYIEGRDPGANFPDAETRSLPNGDALARSVLISPSAIQAGLIRNLEKAESLLAKYGWANLCALRDASIRDGLQAKYWGIAVRDVCESVLNVAADGLASEEQWMLAYPAHVLSSGKNAADRALEMFNAQSGTPEERIQKILVRRMAMS